MVVTATPTRRMTAADTRTAHWNDTVPAGVNSPANRYAPNTPVEPIAAGDLVRLEEDLSELGLYRDDIGVVLSAWYYPNTAYEVEFVPATRRGRCRLLLLEGQISVESAEAVERT